MPPKETEKWVVFETYGDKVVCSRCKKDIAPAIRVLGNEHMCRAYHIFAHVLEDIPDEWDRTNIRTAMELMVAGANLMKTPII